MVPQKRFELPTNSLQNCCTTVVLPRQNTFQILNSKSNREGRSTHTTIIPYEVLQVNSKKIFTIQQLKRFAFFGAGGKIQRHLGTMSYQRSFGRSESRRNVQILYSTIVTKSRVCFNKFYQIPNLPEHQECAHPTNQCSTIEESTN